MRISMISDFIMTFMQTLSFTYTTTLFILALHGVRTSRCVWRGLPRRAGGTAVHATAPPRPDRARPARPPGRGGRGRAHRGRSRSHDADPLRRAAARAGGPRPRPRGAAGPRRRARLPPGRRPRPGARPAAARRRRHRPGPELPGWPEVPFRDEVLGDKARRSRPAIAQALVERPTGPGVTLGLGDDELEGALYRARREAEARAAAEGLAGFHVASLSRRSLVYKALVRGV